MSNNIDSKLYPYQLRDEEEDITIEIVCSQCGLEISHGIGEAIEISTEGVLICPVCDNTISINQEIGVLWDI